MRNYHLLIGVYDHKLGPICISPKINCIWFKEHIEDLKGLIQDGLNTKSKLFTINSKLKRIQIFKFSIKDGRFRGGILRCALFCYTPYEKYLVSSRILQEIAEKYKKIVLNHDTQLNHPECDTIILEREKILNDILSEEIGIGMLEHKRRDLIASIIGFAQLLSEGRMGDLNAEQKKNIEHISKSAFDLLNTNISPNDLLG